jgi:hypothetical protein
VHPYQYDRQGDIVQINPPFGYQNIVPFYKNNRVRLPAPGELPAFARGSNAVPISYSEFASACRDYPLAFVTTDNGKSYSSVAIIGMAGAENLYLENGRWDETVYLPAYIRRYPFCMAKVTLDGKEQADRLVCVEKAFLAAEDDKGGEAMFDAEGKPTAHWESISKLLEEYERDLDRTREMCDILTEYALLEPFTLQATLKDGGPMNLGGMSRINEKNLEFLNAAQHKNLIKKGIMGRIYAHLISLENFARLLARKAAVTKPGAAIK